jgi:aspartate/methionine/tyrosine aminotransferase
MAKNRSNYAHRLEEIQPFRVMKLLARANELAQDGGDVIHMEVGEPDFPTPAPIIEAGQQALLEGRTRYTPASGIPELREAVSGYYRSHYSLEISPDRIFITAGASGALLLTTALLINHGEGLLMTDPGYPCNRHFLKAFHGEGQLIPVTPGTNYQLTADLASRHWQTNTRGVLLASPANPTGAVLDELTLTALYELVRSKHGYVVVDEIYHGLTYEGHGGGRNVSVLEVGQQAFVINSFSKYFGMTGWRLGWLVAPDDAIEELEKLAQNLFICPSAIAQYAALSAFRSDSLEIMEQQRAVFADRRDFLVPGLKNLGFSIPVSPEGAFYVYAGLPHGCSDSERFCNDLLEQHLVAITPGTDFGFYRADEHVRFTYAEEVGRLAEALERIEKALGGCPRTD